MSYAERFSEYFSRDVAEKAAKSLSNGAKIEIHVDSEVFTFGRAAGKNKVAAGAAQDPQLVFTMTPKAAENILNDPATDIGQIGVNIARMVVSGETDCKIGVKFKCGFLTLYSKGYLGVLTAGGSGFATFLASRGLSGMGAVKAALKKVRNE